MRLLNRQADRLQRALDGETITDGEIATFLATARALSTVPTGAMAPRAEFVAALRERLVAEAASMPAATPAAAQAAAARRAAARAKPVVVVVGRGVPRLLAGVAASALAVGAVLGVASQSALPGAALYPVKGWIGHVAVQLAGSDFDRGLVLLGQAQGHISDARSLADLRSTDAADYVTAFEAASEAVRDGHRDLNAAFDATGNPQALLAIRDFATRVRPQLEALRPDVPAAALPALGELQGLIGEAQEASERKLAACAPGCVTTEQVGAGPSDLPNLGSAATATVSGAAGPGATVPRPPKAAPSSSISVPGAPLPQVPRGGEPTGPGVTAGTGGVVVGGDDGGATISTDGTTINGPSLSVSVPVPPRSSVSLGLPSLTVGTGGVGATLPGAELGGTPVLPSATLKLP